ncbi:hypothetical protein JTE90_004454 [Oedothorax gibbosus]|uniref:Uncharacterized protein n=1 Tax=Oedothorax gibbosus TaxID=931172 RepID=A0AAV6UP87_9ARAC|nr:hypothetical protein JTE90_004454 [Oedothorax gibbosus]
MTSAALENADFFNHQNHFFMPPTYPLNFDKSFSFQEHDCSDIWRGKSNTLFPRNTHFPPYPMNNKAQQNRMRRRLEKLRGKSKTPSPFAIRERKYCFYVKANASKVSNFPT